MAGDITQQQITYLHPQGLSLGSNVGAESQALQTETSFLFFFSLFLCSYQKTSVWLSSYRPFANQINYKMFGEKCFPFLFKFLFLCMLCVCGWGSSQSQRGDQIPWAGVRGGYEKPSAGAGYQTKGLWKSSEHSQFLSHFSNHWFLKDL